MFNCIFYYRYDHPHIIAGQGTLGLEICDQVPDIDAVVVPVGGGGLIAGVALAVKSLHPNVKIIVSKAKSVTLLFRHFALKIAVFDKFSCVLNLHLYFQGNKDLFGDLLLLRKRKRYTWERKN